MLFKKSKPSRKTAIQEALTTCEAELAEYQESIDTETLSFVEYNRVQDLLQLKRMLIAALKHAQQNDWRPKGIMTNHFEHIINKPS